MIGPMFQSNVQPKKRLQLYAKWTCPHCNTKNAGARYSCEKCPDGRRPRG